MKKIIILLLIIIMIGFSTGIAQSEQWHPINKKLRAMDPNNPIPFKFPQAPRLPAVMALDLYLSGKAFFIHIGHDGANIMGSVQLSQNKAWNANISKLKQIAKKKMIITY